MNIKKVGDGKVFLISGGGRILTDVAARFVKSEKDLEEIIASDYDRNIVKNILNSGHKAVTEFDYYVFGVEGYARVTEIQLVRKRLASYMIKSGRVDKRGKRSFDMVLPDEIKDLDVWYKVSTKAIKLDSGVKLSDHLWDCSDGFVDSVYINLSVLDILSVVEKWYEEGVGQGVAEENLRYLKPQATEFKALIGMNAHALLDWFQIRCCMNAQYEIRDLANKMLSLCKMAAPDLFRNAGASCKILGYCPENKFQNKNCKGKVLTKDKALEILTKYK